MRLIIFIMEWINSNIISLLCVHEFLSKKEYNIPDVNNSVRLLLVRNIADKSRHCEQSFIQSWTLSQPQFLEVMRQFLSRWQIHEHQLGSIWVRVVSCDLKQSSFPSDIFTLDDNIRIRRGTFI